MNYDAMKIWVDVAQFVITGAIGIYIYLVNRDDKTNARLTKLERDHDERLDDHQGRITRLEATIERLPTHNDLAELKDDVAALKAETSGQTEILRSLNKQVDRITDWLLKK